MNKRFLVTAFFVVLVIFIFAYFLKTPENKESPIESEPTVTGTTWKWEQTSSSDDSTAIPSNPELYTLTLKADNVVSIKADCNSGQGTYKLGDNGEITIEVGMMTLAYCGEDSLDQTYLRDLAQVQTYMMQDGKLFLNLQYDSGTMRFGN